MKRRLRLVSRGVDLKIIPSHVVQLLENSLVEDDLRLYYQTTAICAAASGDPKTAQKLIEKLALIMFPEKSDPANMVEDKTMKLLENMDNWKLKLDIKEASKYLKYGVQI